MSAPHLLCGADGSEKPAGEVQQGPNQIAAHLVHGTVRTPNMLESVFMSSSMPTALITGSAGAIGSATAAAFLDDGMQVVGVDRHTLTQAEDVGLVNGTHPLHDRDAYRHVVADVTDDEQVKFAVQQAAGRGQLHHVVAVAGGAWPGETEASDPVDADPQMFRNSVNLNLVAPFVLARAALPALRRADGDRTITFTSSVNALRGMNLFGYSAAKAGLLSLVETMTVAIAPDGIRVNAVAPGTIRTPRTERAWAHNDRHFEQLADTTALGRLTTADEVAATFLALATQMTAVTGQVIVADAGQIARFR